jgi:hypothetical protein
MQCRSAVAEAHAIEALVILLASPVGAVRKQSARAIRTACEGAGPALINRQVCTSHYTPSMPAVYP